MSLGLIIYFVGVGIALVLLGVIIQNSDSNKIEGAFVYALFSWVFVLLVFGMFIGDILKQKDSK